MKKEELLTLLRDPEICHEIFLIVKNCGQPSVSAARPAEPTPTEPKLTTSRLAAIKEKLQKARRIDGGIEIEIEHELKLPVGQRAAFQLVQIDAQRVESREQLVERAGLMRQSEHDAGSVRAGVDLRLF